MAKKVISIVLFLGLILYFIGIEQEKYLNSISSVLDDRPVILNEDVDFKVTPENIDLEIEVFEEERLSKIDEFLSVIYKLNRCDIIFKGKSGKIQRDELFTPENLKLIEAEWFPKINEFYNYENKSNEKNEYEKRIEKFLLETGKEEENISYQVLKTNNESLKFFEYYFGISSSLSDLQLNSKSILSIDDNKDNLVILSMDKPDHTCSLSEVKEVIKVTEDSDYFYVYISYLKYDSSKISEEIANQKAIEEGANYKLLLKKDLNRYYLDRYEYLR